MFTSLKALRHTNRRGMTLVELMIVVAILGILASVAGVAFLRTVKKAKMAKLESLASKAALGQDDPLRNQYFPPTDTAPVEIFFDGTADESNASKKKQFSTFLKVAPGDVEPGQVLRVITGPANTACTSACCTNAGFTGTQPTRWYVTCAEQDLDNDPGTPPTRAVKTSTNNNVILVNEGQ